MRHLISLVVFAVLAGCDSMVESPGAPDPVPLTADDSARAVLDSNLQYGMGGLYELVSWTRNTLDLGGGPHLEIPAGIDSTMLSRCASIPSWCQRTDSGGLTYLNFDDGLVTNEASSFVSSAELDSALDTSLSKSERLRCAQLASKLLVEEQYSFRGYHFEPPRPNVNSGIRRSGDDTRYALGSWSYEYGSTDPHSTTIFLRHSGSVLRWMQGSSGRADGMWRWWSDSGLVQDGSLSGKARVVWYNQNNQTMVTDFSFADGHSNLTYLAAKNIQRFDTAWLESPGKWKALRRLDTSTIWLHTPDLRDGRFDSMEIHRANLGARWSNAVVKVAWDRPAANPLDTTPVRLRLRGTLGDGKVETIEGTCKLTMVVDDATRIASPLNVWFTFARTVF